MIPCIPVWRGGRILMDGVLKNESYLDFEPDSMVDEDGKIVQIRQGVIPLFEICVYAEHEFQLESKFKLEVESIKKNLSECKIWDDGSPIKMAPKDDNSEKRHTLDWQMFGLFRMIGKRN